MNQTEEKRLKDQKAEKMSRVIQCAAWKIILFAHAFLATYFAYLLIDLEIISVILLLYHKFTDISTIQQTRCISASGYAKSSGLVKPLS